MGSKRATPIQKTKFWAYIEAGMSARAAADRVGLSEGWGYRQLRGGTNSDADLGRRLGAAAPDPKPYDKLDGGVKDLLKPEGFNPFCEAVLCREPVPWRQDAAFRIVEWLMDRTERTYADINTPPGAGKTTLFTHDIPLWLMCGGGREDPAVGRAIRILLGHESKKISIHYVQRLRRMLELRRPFWDKEQRRHADLVLTEAFGRFRPLEAQGEESVWAQDQFIVAQMGNVDLYEKEPTVQAASYQAGFIGERVDFYSWDDLATQKNSRNIEVSDSVDDFFEKEAEPRLEPGGVGVLVGQRLGPIDLHRRRLDKHWTDDEGEVHQRYERIIYPAHSETTCDVDRPGGSHRQWDAKLDGCLLDAHRISWRDIMKIRHEPHFRTVYQQEDTDPSSVLVLPVWIEGGMDPYDYEAPGCWDRERGFLEVPDVAPKERFINYVTVDPSAKNWWAIEWWALLPGKSPHPRDWFRYLIYGRRAKLRAGGGPESFLDWDNASQTHVGVMEKLQSTSLVMGMPIRTWIIEANAAQRHLEQYDHFRRWRQKWSYVHVIPHQTQRNKQDPEFGLQATLPMAYRQGLKRLPRKPGPETLNYMRVKIQELTTYPAAATDDTVMADWFGETHLETIARSGLAQIGAPQQIVTRFNPPPYLRRQYAEASIAR